MLDFPAAAAPPFEQAAVVITVTGLCHTVMGGVFVPGK